MSFYHCYRSHRFTAETQKTVDQANKIIADMQSQGYTLSLRQLYYQFVRRNWIPNEDREYKRLGRLVTRARESGLMDWNAIEDRERECHHAWPEEDPAEVVQGIEDNLLLDQWARQDHYLEVWVEKKALEAIVSRPCDRLDVTYMACKGYLSASEAWRAGLRFQEAIALGKEPTLIHLADHDPSGLNMTEDNASRIRLFAEENSIEVRRIALNMDQVEQYKPPPNPAKESDSRSKAYVKEFGLNSYELDSMQPSMLDALITDTINEYLDQAKWDETLEEQDELRRTSGLVALGDNWDEVREFLEREGLII